MGIIKIALPTGPVRRVRNEDDIAPRRVGAGRVSLVVMTGVPSASAHVVEAVATIPAQSGDDREQLEGALRLLLTERPASRPDPSPDELHFTRESM